MEKKEMSSLTVVELRHELEKRGLEKSGLKIDLLKRLQKSIAEEKKSKEKECDSSVAEKKAEIIENGDTSVTSIADEKKSKEKECDSSVAEKKAEIIENGETSVSVKEKEECSDDSREPDSKPSSVHTTKSIAPGSETSSEKDSEEADSSSASQENLKSDPPNEPVDSTSQQIKLEGQQEEKCNKGDVDPKVSSGATVPEEECNINSKEEESGNIDSPLESGTSTSEMPETELTQEPADSTTSDQQAKDIIQTEDSSVESTRGNSNDSVSEDQGETQDLNELPEDERVEEPQTNDNEPIEESGGDVVVVPDEDLKDETMPEEDRIDIRCESEEEFECVDDSMNEDPNDNIGCVDEEMTQTDPNNQSNVVVIDDDDTDDVTIIEPEESRKDVTVIEREESKKDGITDSDDKLDTNHISSGEKDITEIPADKSENDLKTEVDASKKSAAELNASSVPNEMSTSSKSKPHSRQSSKDTKSVSKTEHPKDEKKDLARCLWVSGLSSITKAIDLKERFSKHGKVIGAKVVTSAKTPGSQCFGFVTLSTAEEAVICIEKLHKSLLHEKHIQVEQAKTDPTPSKKSSSKSKSGERKDDGKRSRHPSKISSSRSRRDDRGNRRYRDSSKRSDGERKRSEKGKDKTSSSSTPKRSTSKDSSKDKHSKVGSNKGKNLPSSKEKITVVSKNQVEKVEVTSKDLTSDSKSDKVEKDDVPKKSLDLLKKERAEKIEREHKLRKERKEKERERERLLREERRREQEKREKERRERARREVERVRREREKQREVEKQREREREQERERFIRERREREDKERKEMEKEREQMERERLERERLDRERRERERLEKERIERERQERDRLEKERIAREEHDFRVERERQRLEKERLDRDRRVGVMVDRGLGSKRPLVSDDRRGLYPEPKRSLREVSPSSRKDFFSPPGSRDERLSLSYTADGAYDRTFARRDDTHKVDSRGKPDVLRDGREPRRSSREDSRGSSRHDTRLDSRGLGYDQHSTDIRRVVPRDPKGDAYSRERSPHRGLDTGRERSPHRGLDAGLKYRGDLGSRSQSWLDSPNSSAPKTLSDVLGRAGLSGILGSRAEEKSEKNYSGRNSELSNTRSAGDRYFSSGNHDSLRPERSDDRGYRADVGSTVIDYRLARADSRERREPRADEHRASRDDDRRGSRYDDRRTGERLDHPDDRSEFRRDDRTVDYKHNRQEISRDERRETRGDYRRESLPASANSSISSDRNYVGSRGLPPLASDIATVVPNVLQPRVVPLTDVFGRPLQAVANPTHALQAGYAAAAQGLALQNVATGIQLNRNGRLEYTRMPPPPTNVSSVRRF